jgi:tetratricopeptide (TPR) repeat protein
MQRAYSPLRQIPRHTGIFGACLLGLTLAACAGPQQSAKPARAPAAELGPITPTAVDDATFAASAYRVLVGADTGQKRASLLAGVVARQLERARTRFDSERPENGFTALQGAFLLMRRGEFRREALTHAAPTLEQGAAVAARLGEEGYSLALYSLLGGLLPPGANRDDVEGHLAAMSSFHAMTSTEGPLVAAGSDARVAAQRAVLDSSDEEFRDASQRLLTWIGKARQAGQGDIAAHSNADREEAYKALRGGGYELVALYLRHNDPLGALTAVDEAGLDRAVPPDLRARLEATAQDDDPEAWVDLFRLYDSLAREVQAVLSLDPRPFEGAAWGTAVSLFRAEPGSFRGTMPLATRLVDYGMAEVAPLVLASGLARGAAPEQLSAALAVVLNATVAEAEAGQQDAARRTFESSAPLLELASSKAFAGRVSPSPARFRYVMGALEAGRGDLARAEPLLEAAVQEEPSVEALRVLAAIARQKRDVPATLKLLERARAVAEKNGSAVDEADIWHTEFEVLRDSGDHAGAAQALDRALTRALDATKQARPGATQARAERLLAHVLEHFGDLPAMRRATERGYDAAALDVNQLSATITDTARRAFTRRDLAAARNALSRAMDASLPPDELVYIALWLALLERQLGVPTDGSVEDAFAAMDEAPGWSGRLRAWARGKIGDGDLLAAARDPAQRTEALFYTTMARRAAGDANTDSELAKIAQSEAVNLVEIGIARDLLALKSGAEAGYKLPAGVSLP